MDFSQTKKEAYKSLSLSRKKKSIQLFNLKKLEDKDKYNDNN